MKKILVVGNSPLPNENTKCRPAGGLRTYQFLKTLEHVKDVAVKNVNIAMPECYDNKEAGEGSISKDDPSLVKKLQAVHDSFKPDILIGVNTFPSYMASRLKSDATFWADLNGWVMAEAQAQAFKSGHNDYLPHYYEMERSILSRADKVSAVSKNEMYAILGELAMLGRLRAENFDYNFMEHVPNATEMFENEKNFGNASENVRKKFEKLPKNAFKLLWLGGYNTWVDEETLFDGVEKAMERCKNLHYISTGGEIAGLDNKTFARFKARIEKSEFKDRFVFLGWVDTADIPYIYKEVDAGLNVDLHCVETLTGARNRINEMMKFGVPVVSTLGSEISYEMEKHGCGLGVTSGNALELTEAIARLYRLWGAKSDEFFEFGKCGQMYIKEKCSYEACGKPVLKWLRVNHKSDHGGSRFTRAMPSKIGKARIILRYVKENGLKKTFFKVVQRFF